MKYADKAEFTIRKPEKTVESVLYFERGAIFRCSACDQSIVFSDGLMFDEDEQYCYLYCPHCGKQLVYLSKSISNVL